MEETTMGPFTVDVKAAPVKAAEIRWLSEDQLFENLDTDVGALSRLDLEAYAIELRGECRFLRIAWRSAVERHGWGESLRSACEPYRAGIAAAWLSDAESGL
jgi:hypothetical protein